MTSIKNLLKKPARTYLALFFALTSFSSLLTPTGLYASSQFRIPSHILNNAVSIYGAEATRRLLEWQSIINTHQHLDELTQIKKANTFINSISFAEDIDHWQETDYWASPIEFIGSNGGDCEDYAIAKYFTLKAMGFDKARIHIAYVNVKDRKAPHMVLLYYTDGNASPLVLDNIHYKIKRLNERREIEVVYSANENGVWVVSADEQYTYLGGSSIIHKWSALIEIMKDLNFHE